MRTVIRNSKVGGITIDIGVLEIEDQKLTIRDLEGHKILENQAPVPDSKPIHSMIHEVWRENPDVEVIWPLSEGYIRNLSENFV